MSGVICKIHTVCEAASAGMMYKAYTVTGTFPVRTCAAWNGCVSDQSIALRLLPCTFCLESFAMCLSLCAPLHLWG